MTDSKNTNLLPKYTTLFSRKMILWIGALGSALSILSASVLPEWTMPEKADQVHLSWVKGPPQLQVFRPIDTYLEGFREDASLLSFRSEHWGMLFHPGKMTISQFTFEQVDDSVADTLDYSSLLESWAKSELTIGVEIRDTRYQLRASKLPTIEENYKYSPIHIVESGPWFQHVAIYNFEFVNKDGDVLPAETWFEVRAWGDKCIFELNVVPTDGSRVKLTLGLASEELGFNESVSAIAPRIQLGLGFNDGEVSLLEAQNSVSVAARTTDDFTRGQPKTIYSPVTDSWEVYIPKQDWPEASGQAYNPSLLDRISNFDVQLVNDADEPRDICLRFIHDYHSIVGYVPMILDADGQQTGLPIQNSKNWHVLKDEPYPYEGSWIHTTTRFSLAPNTKLDLKYVVVHAMWQGLPASSVAQLCLTGWGYNGFWTQMALGSWGETACIQPGRTMRRAFITDMRPFEVLGIRQNKSYDWTSNVGGGDIAFFVDKNGKYLPWVGSITEYLGLGPNLSHTRVVERSADESMRLTIDTYLPRSNSIHRTYFKAKLEILKDIDFSDFALFQLGNDYYNEMDSRKIAWGAEGQLGGEASPGEAEWGVVMDPIALEGEQPWVSLYSNKPDTKTRGQGIRAIVVRDFKAQLGEEILAVPYLRAGRTMSRLNADLVLPPEVRKFSAGDVIEWTVEFDVYPISADVYYGQNVDLRQQLSASEDSWQIVASGAVTQSLQLNGEPQVFPATYQVRCAAKDSFTVKSTSSLDTLVIEGLGHPDSWKILERLDGAILELGQRYSVEADPQINYIPETASWTAVLSLQFPDGARQREFVVEQYR